MKNPKLGPPPSRNPTILLHFPAISFSFLHFLTVSILFLALYLPATAESSTIYDQLRHYGLPIGLLPKGITQFSINSTSGQFQVFLDQPCNAKFENQVHYDFNVSGRLSFGRIGELSGVSAQELFLWFPVKGIRVDLPSSGLIYFDVGVVDKQFSLSLFESPPDCTAADPVEPSSVQRRTTVDGNESGSKNELQNAEREGGRKSELRAVS